MTKNLPVPPGSRAPLGHRWLWSIGPAAVLTLLYRAVPPRIRSRWNPARTPNSHIAMRAIVAGGGWRSFFRFAVPQLKEGIPWWLDD